MSAKKKKKDEDEELSVAQAMQLVRWDFVPEDEEDSFEVSTGAFFEEFPWEGSSDTDDSGAGKPKNRG